MLEQNSPAEEVFSAAWDKVRRGRSISSVLAEYPEHAAELEPMLRLSQSVRDLLRPNLSPDTLARLQQRTQAAAEARRPASGRSLNTTTQQKPPVDLRNSHSRPPARRKWWFLPSPAAHPFSRAAALSLLVLAASLLLIASALLLRSGDQPVFDRYSGTITSIESSRWLVTDKAVGDSETILLDANTVIHGQPVVGAEMTCIGETLSGDRMRAIEVWISEQPGGPTVTPPSSRAVSPPD